MGNRVPLASQEFYHIYNRGTEKRKVFMSKADYERFVTLLYLCNSAKPLHLNNHRGSTSVDLLAVDKGEPLVDIATYCLMPNHFHLLVRPRGENSVSKFMQKLTTGYTMYFNKKYGRTGALFQGKFKSSHAGEDKYLKYLIAYIHLNPAKIIEPQWKEKGVASSTKMRKYLEEYPYSSYVDYLGTRRPENAVINKVVLPLYFESTKALRKDMKEWLQYTEVEPRCTGVY